LLAAVDKSSSAELTESINSMFQWYGEAVVCYVLLEDLPPATPPHDGIQRCRWFSREWTLQELLAPDTVHFFDQTWVYVGSKRHHAELISGFTRIPSKVLLDGRKLSQMSVASRMACAAFRETTRLEDMAYSVLGIFDVNMPLIYGEGMKAFRRLQEEIMKRNNDLTILAWNISPGALEDLINILASSPRAFSSISEVMPSENGVPEFSITNKGLFLAGDFVLIPQDAESAEGRSRTLYALLLGSESINSEQSTLSNQL
jgi:hypothetical protein